MTPIFLITGTPGVGKSTTAEALMQRFPFGMHIPMDDLREWVVAGLVHPIPTFTPEAGRQFWLARQAAALTARLYSEQGFAVAIDDVIAAEDAALFDSAFTGLPFFKILLHPPVETALSRNIARTNKDFDTAVLHEVIQRLHTNTHPDLYRAANWLILDNSDLSVNQTVDRILEYSHTIR